jgi:hypothetical protein
MAEQTTVKHGQDQNERISGRRNAKGGGKQ